MIDMKLQETCPHCRHAIVLMESHALEHGRRIRQLVKRCTHCAEYPIEIVADLMPPRPTDSEMCSAARMKHEELARKGWEYRAFYNGFLEGFEWALFR